MQVYGATLMKSEGNTTRFKRLTSDSKGGLIDRSADLIASGWQFIRQPEARKATPAEMLFARHRKRQRAGGRHEKSKAT